jgi:pyridoxamine 5'-phosphate oxidase
MLGAGDAVSAIAYRQPFDEFAAWFAEAQAREPRDADAMTVATATADGVPAARMILLKGVDEQGFVFYTNFDSRKGGELAANPRAALCFHWKSMLRQVRIEGTVAAVSAAEADAYFAGRPRSSQIGAWASKQSSPLESRLAFEKAIAVTAAKFAIGRVPRPPFWIGYRVTPTVMEFWHDRPYRLHDRIEFSRADAGAAWTKTRLYP